jgi:hypothetical protein
MAVGAKACVCFGYVSARISACFCRGNWPVGVLRIRFTSAAAQKTKTSSSIPGTVEKISHGEPTFFTPKRFFAMFADNHHGDGHVAVWIPAAPGVQAALFEEALDIYFRPPYVGVAGWVGVELPRINDEQLGTLIREAFRLMTVKTIASDRSELSQPARAEKAPRRSRKA